MFLGTVCMLQGEPVFDGVAGYIIVVRIVDLFVHDGQFFPLNIAIRTAWENPAGLKTVGRMTSVVTSGVGVYGPDMRIGTDADISVVDIQFAP